MQKECLDAKLLLLEAECKKCKYYIIFEPFLQEGHLREGICLLNNDSLKSDKLGNYSNVEYRKKESYCEHFVNI